MPKSFIIIFLYILASFSLFAEVIDVSNKKDAPPQALLQLNVIDVQETWLENRKTLSVSFSQKLDKNIPYDSFVTVTEDGISLKGEWIQSENPTCLYLTNIKPEKKYEIFIRPGIKSENGLKLLTPKHFNITTKALSSEVHLLEDQQNLSPHNFSALHIRSSDIKNQDVSLYRLNDTQHKEFTQKLQTTPNLSNWSINDVTEVSNLIIQKNISIDNTENKRVLSTVKLKDDDVKTGLYFVSINATSVGGDVIKQLKYFNVSSLDLVTADESTNDINMFTVSKNTGTLLPNATLQFVTSEQIIEKTSDKGGRVSLTKQELSQFSWVHLTGKQKITADKDEQVDLGYLFQRNVSKSQSSDETKSITAKVFLNKQYYKLGDELGFSILLRNKNDKAIAKKQLKISLQTPYGQSIDKQLITTSDLGAISGYFQLPDTDIVATNSNEQASWRINVYLDANDEDILSFSDFHLGKADYLASKLEINSNGTIINPQKKTSFEISAFIDEEVPTENVPVTLKRSITWLKSPSHKYQDFNFGLKTDMDLNGIETLQVLKFDNQGQAKLILPQIKNKIHSALSVAIQAEIKIGDMPIAQQSKTLAYWPADDMVGVRVDTNSGSADFNTQIDIIDINQADELLEAENLQIKLIKLNSDNKWRYTHETWTWSQKDSGKENIIEEKSLSLIAADIGKLQLSLEQGSYRVEIENPSSGLLTQHEFTVGDVTQTNYLANPNQLGLSLDKESASKKETALLRIDSIISGEAIIQLSSPATTLWRKKTILQAGKTQVEIPLDNITPSQEGLHITVLGFHKQKQQYFTSKGEITIPVDKTKATLNLSIIAKDRALIVHSDDYKNIEAVISIEQKKQADESLLPKITALTQSLRFDKNGDARINNNDAKVSRNNHYSAKLFFADKTVAGLATTFLKSED